MYKFNPQHIADLAAGKIICQHTKKEEDLPLLRAVLEKTFPDNKEITRGKWLFYYASLLGGNYWLGRNDFNEIKKPVKIIPLHDFLAKDEFPKEDLARIDLMDKRLKELEGLVRGYGYTIVHKAEIAEPKDVYFVFEELVITNYYRLIIERKGKLFSELEADQTADLIKWVLDNQETVLKLKNNDK